MAVLRHIICARVYSLLLPYSSKVGFLERACKLRKAWHN